jgi:small-conductance mechanosensitive channel
VLIGSELWRRATFRYVKDARRRQQSMLVRRILVTTAVLLLVVFSLINELGSLATFAGFITAGLAVALQNVILSVAAYFFLIGRYGIRVGDRVQIGEVQGEVIDLGLVRMHVMELREGAPTGRVVVYSNAAVFSGNFFKQLPGSSFAWHQVRLTLSPDSDYKLAESSLMAAVESVYATIRDELVAQHERVAQQLSISVAEPRPSSQLHFTDSGLEMVIRFAVPLARAAEVDDRVTKALLDAVAREPRLKMAGAGKPTIESGAAAAEPAPAPAAH